MAKVKYHFALNDKGQIIDIADVTEETKHDKYYCLNCGDENAGYAHQDTPAEAA